ncbi:hypothetical protein H5410_057961 [Solanum commersonii]|uniref:Uncharacterized protein n=1 Tax=Solanum commersonii TaxID=4109 RepID=A0A9J5WPC6_SOLCO|nr:hypothetical protein H5410_057961 [Solanum commersonii]
MSYGNAYETVVVDQNSSSDSYYLYLCINIKEREVTSIEQATIALSILREHIDQFDLVMVDANMLETDYLEFIKSTQLIKDKPIICKTISSKS